MTDMETRDDRIGQIKEMLAYQKGIRAKSDKTRWQAFAYLKHRTKDQTTSDDCPVKDIELFDSAGVRAFSSFIDGFMGAFMSPSQKWFKGRLKPRNFKRSANIEPDYGYEYTDYLDNAIKDEMDHTNHYEAQKMASRDTIAGGYSCMMIQNDPETDRCFYETLLPWRCYFDHDLHGNWNEFYYEYTLNGYQLLDRFPDLDPNSRLYKDAARGGKNSRFQMLMVILKRGFVRNEDGYVRKFNKNKKFASLEICMSTEQILEEGGYDDFPLIIHTWEKPGDSQYGSGIGSIYLQELKKLNRLGYEYGITVAKINHGAWLVPEGMKNKFSDEPEARVYYQTKELLPIQLQERLDIQDQLQALLQQENAVKSLFHNELFDYFLSTDKVYTATQVNQVKSDSVSTLAFAFFNIQKQKFDPAIKLTMKIMIDNKRIEVDPTYIGKKSGNKLEFILDSAMAQMLQTYTQINSVNALLEMAASLVNLQITDPLKNFDWDNIVRSYMHSVGSPAEFIVSKSKVEETRAEEAEAMKKQMALQEQLTNSEINRNNAGAANLNNVQGMNGGIN